MGVGERGSFLFLLRAGCEPYCSVLDLAEYTNSWMVSACQANRLRQGAQRPRRVRVAVRAAAGRTSSTCCDAKCLATARASSVLVTF